MTDQTTPSDASVSARYPTLEERVALERRVLAPALYGAWARHAEGVVVTEGPLRGRVTLFSCYTPAWWYASCESCPWLSASSEDYDDPALAAAAESHRCAAQKAEEEEVPGGA